MKRLTVIFCLFTTLVFLFSGCQIRPEAPELDAAIAYFDENRDDIQLVTEFLLTQDKVYIVAGRFSTYNATDTLLTDEIQSAIKRLRNDQPDILICKAENTIQISMFFPSMREISSGFAYSINGVDAPEVQYTVEMLPLTEPGWYYYVEDFNTWRVESTRDPAATTE